MASTPLQFFSALRNLLNISGQIVLQIYQLEEWLTFSQPRREGKDGAQSKQKKEGKWTQPAQILHIVCHVDLYGLPSNNLILFGGLEPNAELCACAHATWWAWPSPWRSLMFLCGFPLPLAALYGTLFLSVIAGSANKPNIGQFQCCNILLAEG